MKGVVKPIPHPTRPLVDNQPSRWPEWVNVRQRHLVEKRCAEDPEDPARAIE